jgi:hypothetical protein
MSRVPVKLPPLFEQAREAINSKHECEDPMTVGALIGCFAMAAAPYRFRIVDKMNGPALWIALVGDPSCGKSPAIYAAAAPLLSYAALINEEARKAWRQYKMEMKAHDAALKEWAKTDCKNGVPFGNIEPPRPKLQYRSVTDVTLEGLLRLHADSLGIGILPDELTTWLGSFSRYSNASSRSTWLTLFSGVLIDQKRADIELSREVTNPCVSVLSGIQPEMLDELKTGMKDGLSYRMIFFSAKSQKKYLRIGNERSIKDNAALAAYEAAVLDWMNAHKEVHEPLVIVSHPEADLALKNAIDPMRDRFCESDAPNYSPQMHSMWKKMEIYMHRLAGVHCLMRHVSAGANTRTAEVKAVDIEWAAQLIELVLLPESIKIMALIQQSGERPVMDSMLPAPLAAFVDALPEGPFAPLGKPSINAARQTIPEFANMSNEEIKSRLRSIFKSKAVSHLFGPAGGTAIKKI